MLRETNKAVVPRYTSAWNPGPAQVEVPIQRSVDYDFYAFIKTEYSVDSRGTLTSKKSDTSESIEIAANWQKSAAAKDIDDVDPLDGYLGKGFVKFAFRVGA